MTEEEIKTFARKLEEFAKTLAPSEQKVFRDALADSQIFIKIPGDEADLAWYG